MAAGPSTTPSSSSTRPRTPPRNNEDVPDEAWFFIEDGKTGDITQIDLAYKRRAVSWRSGAT
jgi:hypothetical protein